MQTLCNLLVIFHHGFKWDLDDFPKEWSLTKTQPSVSEEQPRAPGLSDVEKRRLMGNLIALYSFLRRKVQKEVLSSSSWDPVLWHAGMVQSCVGEVQTWP